MRYVPPFALFETIDPSRASSTLTVVHVCVSRSTPPPLTATNDLFTPLLAEKYLVLTQLRHSLAHSRIHAFTHSLLLHTSRTSVRRDQT